MKPELVYLPQKRPCSCHTDSSISARAHGAWRERAGLAALIYSHPIGRTVSSFWIFNERYIRAHAQSRRGALLLLRVWFCTSGRDV